jgi:hypothetical protein
MNTSGSLTYYGTYFVWVDAEEGECEPVSVIVYDPVRGRRYLTIDEWRRDPRRSPGWVYAHP